MTKYKVITVPNFGKNKTFENKQEALEYLRQLKLGAVWTIISISSGRDFISLESDEGPSWANYDEVKIGLFVENI
jgi:hypothetical protein